MPNKFYQIPKADLPFLNRFSKAINLMFALATVWEFFQAQKRVNSHDAIVVTTSEIARYSANEILNALGKKLYYADVIYVDYCEVNYKMAYYRKITHLISMVLGDFPRMVCVTKKEGIPIYKLAITDSERNDLYADLAKASSIKAAIIKNVLENNDQHLSIRSCYHYSQLLNSITPAPIRPKSESALFELLLSIPSSNDRSFTVVDDSFSVNDRPIKFIDESFSFQKSSKTDFFPRKRKQVHPGDVDTDSRYKKSNNTTSPSSTCLPKYMAIQFILN